MSTTPATPSFSFETYLAESKVFQLLVVFVAWALLFGVGCLVYRGVKFLTSAKRAKVLESEVENLKREIEVLREGSCDEDFWYKKKELYDSFRKRLHEGLFVWSQAVRSSLIQSMRTKLLADEDQFFQIDEVREAFRFLTLLSYEMSKKFFEDVENNGFEKIGVQEDGSVDPNQVDSYLALKQQELLSIVENFTQEEFGTIELRRGKDASWQVRERVFKTRDLLDVFKENENLFRGKIVAAYRDAIERIRALHA